MIEFDDKMELKEELTFPSTVLVRNEPYTTTNKNGSKSTQSDDLVYLIPDTSCDNTTKFLNFALHNWIEDAEYIIKLGHPVNNLARVEFRKPNNKVDTYHFFLMTMEVEEILNKCDNKRVTITIIPPKEEDDYDHLV